MQTLSKIGRICYAISMAEMGLHTIIYHNFPYMLIPYQHAWIPGLTLIAYVSGALLLLAAASILLEWKTRAISLDLGGVLLLIFFFYYIPYGILHYQSVADWENATKELALAGGAFIVAGCFPATRENNLDRYLAKLVPFGAIVFCIPILHFGIVHFLMAPEASTLVPKWIPGALFWTYFAGAALIAAGVAIILKIKTELAATLLGVMILLWFIIIHIPRIIDSPALYLPSEVTSAMLALAYGGIAFVIAGNGKARGGVS